MKIKHSPFIQPTASIAAFFILIPHSSKLNDFANNLSRSDLWIISTAPKILYDNAGISDTIWSAAITRKTPISIVRQTLFWILRINLYFNVIMV